MARIEISNYPPWSLMLGNPRWLESELYHLKWRRKTTN